jgi:alpha-D-xyloside xylohydrolase
LDSVFRIEGIRLIRRYDAEELWVEPWGANSLRVRATELAVMQKEDWALLPQEASNVQISVVGQTASIQNGNIRAEISAGGRLTFLNRAGKVLLQEYVRNLKDIQEYKSALNIEGREFKPILGGDYSLAVRFESDPEE